MGKSEITSPREMRVTRLDLVSGRSGWRRALSELAGVFLAFGVVVTLRSLVDIWLPNTAPFALAYPGLILATLMGRLRSGLLAWMMIFVYLWLVGIHHGPNFSFVDPVDLPRTVINMAVGLIVVMLTESARAGAASLLAELEQHVAERDLLLSEFDHRLKNNLTILSSLIGMQAREAENPDVVEALGKASARITSLGKTYDHLRYEPGAIATVDLGQLIDSLCTSLRDSILAESPITLASESCPCPVERDRASALALLINELVTNAAKHAFVGRNEGRVDVTLKREGAEALLSVCDDGVGIPAESPAGRQGMRLLNALAKMAHANLFVTSTTTGTRFEVRLGEIPAD